jgi:biopolymer transport protein ExbD
MDYNSPLDAVPQISEINMTPLMDLTFILLITFIITFPLIEQGIPLNLPKGSATELSEDESRTVSMDLQGRLYLDERPVEEGDLAEQMAALGRANPDIAVYVRADQSVEYGRVASLLRVLQKANISRLALVTEAEDQ